MLINWPATVYVRRKLLQEVPSMTIDALIQKACQKYSDRPALRQKVGGVWQETTYGLLWTASDRIAAGLLREGFKPGEHAAILAPSSTRWIIAYLGVLKAGGVVVPVDKELKSAELRHVLGDSAARVLFLDGRHLDTILGVVRHLPDLSRLVLLGPEGEGEGEDPRAAKAVEALVDEWHSLVEELPLPAERAERLER